MAPWRCRLRLLTLGAFLAISLSIMPACPARAAEANPPYPDVGEMCREPFDDDFLDGAVACGWEALRYRMRSNMYRSNIGRLDDIQLTQFERLLVGDPDDVRKVNEEIIAFCRRKQAALEKAWAEPERRHPALEVCNYQTELIPLAIIALRVGEQLTPQAHRAIRDVLLAFRPEAAASI